MNCPLCESKNVKLLEVDGDKRKYYLCRSCFLLFVDPDYHISLEQEKARYEFHNNSGQDVGYLEFLNRVIQPTLPFLNSAMIGLDYGCGPNPTLSDLLAQQQLICHNFDPLFGFEHSLKAYDFLFATECVEHFRSPKNDFSKMSALLKPKGFLSVMTDHWQSLEQFNTWYYKRDITHVSFYHSNTFAFICKYFGYELKYTDNQRVVVMQRV
ncbi:MAG: class I SAM-dependent methyltransferase [Cyclobacteriaceae bacterium]|nr:class I SAM-dependent methyltransferase [Cyclobacteriaceae bacterium]